MKWEDLVDELKQEEFSDYRVCDVSVEIVRDDIMIRLFAGCCVLSVALLATGCTGNPFKSSSLTTTDDALASAAAEQDSGNAGDVQAPKYRVTIFATGAKPAPRDMVFSGGLTLNDAIDRSGARDQFGRMKVDLIRTGKEGVRHKLEVKLNSGGNRIEPLYDYAVRPGDHIMITQDNTTDLSRMMDELNPF